MIKKIKLLITGICTIAGIFAVGLVPLSSCSKNSAKDPRDKTEDTNVTKVEIPTIEVGKTFTIKVTLKDNKTVDGNNTVITIGGNALSYASQDFTIVEQENNNTNVHINVKAEKVINTDVTVKVVSKDKEPAPIPIEKVELDKSAIDIEIGTIVKINSTVLPQTAVQTVTWSSTDNTIASVDNNGNITAHKNGTVYIVATSKQDTTKSALCVVTIVPSHVQEVKLNKTSTSIVIGNKEKLVATVLPATAVQSVTWSSSDDTIASVDDGEITALKTGSVIIKATSSSDTSISASCNVTITPIPIEKVELNKTTTTIEAGLTEKLTATITPSTAVQTVTWSSSNTAIATVDDNGTITTIKDGDVVITATSTQDESKSASCNVIVVGIPIAEVALNKSNIDMSVGYTSSLKASVLPETAVQNVSWTSSDSSIVEIEPKSINEVIVKAKKPGSITVTATSIKNPQKFATCTVNVTVAISSISLDKDSLTIPVGDDATLSATVSPAEAYQGLDWQSSDSTVSTVDENGKITPINPGTAVITVKSHIQTDKWATCTVNVVPSAAQEVRINKTITSIVEGQSETLIAQVLPSSALQDVSWKSNNEAIATVDENGKVTAIKEGKATITATSKSDKTKYADCIVVVSPTYITVNILDSAHGSVVKDQIRLPKNNKFSDIEAQLLECVKADQNYIVGHWIIMNDKGFVDCNDDTKLTDGSNIKVLFNAVNPSLLAISSNYWGDINVKYKFLSNHECRLLTKYGGADSEYGYISGTGNLQIPNYVIYNGEPYYIKQIPSDWSDECSEIKGLTFNSDVRHLKTICYKAFYRTDALDYYAEDDKLGHQLCKFPEGLETIENEAFEWADGSLSRNMKGFYFPSTLYRIGESAFSHIPYINGDDKFGKTGELWFACTNQQLSIGAQAFNNSSGAHYVKYVYAPTEQAANAFAAFLDTTKDFMTIADDYLKACVIPVNILQQNLIINVNVLDYHEQKRIE